MLEKWLRRAKTTLVARAEQQESQPTSVWVACQKKMAALDASMAALAIDASPYTVRIGIMGCASIAKKNARAIMKRLANPHWFARLAVAELQSAAFQIASSSNTRFFVLLLCLSDFFASLCHLRSGHGQKIIRFLKDFN